jgi:uncharacterized protein YfaT (DUF1175 family)
LKRFVQLWLQELQQGCRQCSRPVAVAGVGRAPAASGTQPHTTKKEAEQHAAQLMLQQLEPNMPLTQEQQALAGAQQVAAGAAAGLQAVFQAQQQQQQQ